MTFVKFLGAGHDGTNLSAQLVADDGKKYEFSITPECLVRLFAGLWMAAKDVAVPASVSGEAPYLQGAVSFAVADMKPSLTLTSGPLTLLLQIDAGDMKYLLGQMQGFDRSQGRPQ